MAMGHLGGPQSFNLSLPAMLLAFLATSVYCPTPSRHGKGKECHHKEDVSKG